MQKEQLSASTNNNDATRMVVDGERSTSGDKDRGTQRPKNPVPAKKRKSVTYEGDIVAKAISTPLPSASNSVTPQYIPSCPDSDEDENDSFFEDLDEEDESPSRPAPRRAAAGSELDSASSGPVRITPATFVLTNLWDPANVARNQQIMRVLTAMKDMDSTLVQEFISFLGRAGSYKAIGPYDAAQADEFHLDDLEETLIMLKGARAKKEVMISPYRLLEYLFRTQSQKMSVTTSPLDILCGNVSFTSVLGGVFSTHPDPRTGMWSSADLGRLQDALSLELGINLVILDIPIAEYRSLSRVINTLEISVRDNKISIKSAPPYNRKEFLKVKGVPPVLEATRKKCVRRLATYNDTIVNNKILASYDIIGYLWKFTTITELLPAPCAIMGPRSLTISRAAAVKKVQKFKTFARGIMKTQSSNRAARNRMMKYIPEMDHYLAIGFLTKARRKKLFVSSLSPDYVVTNYKTTEPQCPTIIEGKVLFYDPGLGHSINSGTADKVIAALQGRDFETLKIYLPLMMDVVQLRDFANKLFAYAIANMYFWFRFDDPEQAHSPYFVLTMGKDDIDGMSRNNPQHQPCAVGTVAKKFAQLFGLGMVFHYARVGLAESNYMSACAAGVPYPWLPAVRVAVPAVISVNEAETRSFFDDMV